MQPKLVNLCVKNPDPLINYSYSAPIVFQEVVPGHFVNFPIESLIQEVKKLPKETIKRYKQIIQTFIVTATSFLTLPFKSMANTTQVVPSLPTVGNNISSVPGMPPEIMDLLLKLLVISVGSAVVLGAILLIFAGVRRMFGQKKQASEWTVDILKGLTQVLISVPTVFLIYYLISLLFKGTAWYVSPF